MQKRKILVISNDANLNGAPITLLRLMHLLYEQGWRFNTLLSKSGPLEQEFRLLSEVFGVYDQFESGSYLKMVIKCLLRWNKKARPRFKPAKFAEGVELILSNTITNGVMLARFEGVFAGPVYSYVHEMKMSTLFYTNQKALKYILDRSSNFLVSSNAVRDYLINDHGIQSQYIARLNYYLPPMPQAACHEVEQFLREYGLTTSFIVAAIGINDWRKGYELFISVMTVVLRKRPEADIRFVWLGGYQNSPETVKMLHDVKAAGLEDKLVIIPSSKKYTMLYQQLDVFLLPSREDPFPLVVLEAAYHRVPVICFNNAGGAPEFVGDDAGTVVPYLDIIAMADAIIGYYDDPALRTAHGAQAHRRVIEQYANGQLILQQFNQLLSLQQTG